MKPESYSFVYINLEWRNPVEVHTRQSHCVNLELYFKSTIVFRVYSETVYLIRDTRRSDYWKHPLRVAVSKRQLTQLRLGAIPPGLLDYLTSIDATRDIV